MNLLLSLSVICCAAAIVSSDGNGGWREEYRRPYLYRINSFFDKARGGPKPNPRRPGMNRGKARGGPKPNPRRPELNRGRPGQNRTPFRPLVGPSPRGGLPGPGRRGSPMPGTFPRPRRPGPASGPRPGPGGPKSPLRFDGHRFPLSPRSQTRSPPKLGKRRPLPRRKAPGPRKSLGRFTARRMGQYKRKRMGRLFMMRKALSELRKKFSNSSRKNEEEGDETLLEEFLMKLADIFDKEDYGDDDDPRTGPLGGRGMRRGDGDYDDRRMGPFGGRGMRRGNNDDYDRSTGPFGWGGMRRGYGDWDEEGDDDRRQRPFGGRPPMRRGYGADGDDDGRRRPGGPRASRGRGRDNDDDDGTNRPLGFPGRPREQGPRRRFNSSRLNLMKTILRQLIMRLVDEQEEKPDEENKSKSLLVRLLDLIMDGVDKDGDDEDFDDGDGEDGDKDKDSKESEEVSGTGDEEWRPPRTRYGLRRRWGGLPW